MLRRLFFLFLIPLSFAFADETKFEESIKSFIEQFLHESGDKKKDSFTTTSHTIDIPSGPISYTAVTGMLPQFIDNGEIVGQIFFTAYLKESDDPNRPVTFIFNGGPGGSSMSMHIGGFGPRRLALPEEGQKPLPPYQMVDNPETMLDTTDIVLIDPISTGYSQAQHEYKRAYYSVEGDLYSFAEFIRMFCIHFDRWNSPKYLIGASYGTCRAIGLAETLTNNGIHLNGIVLMSTVFDYHLFVRQRDLPLSDWLSIPSFAATAWYHKKAMQDKTLDEVLDYARTFAYEQYAPVMLQPSRLSPLEQKAFYQTMADLIGLPLDTIRRFEGRIDEEIYVKEFLASERKVIGGIDSRFIGDVSALSGEYNEDPSYRDFRACFYPAYLNYLQTELETKKEFPKYTSFSSEAFLFWNWSTYDSDNLPNFLQRLRRTLVDNPYMKVFIGSGYYDLRTPFAATEYSLDHLELPNSYRNNFQIEYYPAGHAYIFDLHSLRKFKKDLMKFYAE